MSKVSQCKRVLQYMEDEGSITSLDAIREFGCMRLASRVSDLKRAGYPITREMESKKNRYGDTVRYARYRLEAAE